MPGPGEDGVRLERFRVELTGYCYRMLGSAFEAEDAVQETLVRAWRSLDRFDEDRAPLRSWLYTIATNVCLDMLRVAQRRATGVASVTGALRGARVTLRPAHAAAGEPSGPLNQAQRDLLSRYCDAFERYDVAALVSLLHQDAVMSMPPFPWWLRGRAEIERALLAAGRPCEGARLVATAAHGPTAFAQYRPARRGGIHPIPLVLLTPSG